jgi:hypothetical protein
MAWHTDFAHVRPYIVRLETPQGFGTGFLFAYNSDKVFAAIATAAHVVEYANDWKLPIKIRHHESGKEIFLLEAERYIDLDRRRDSASVILANPGFLPDQPLQMIDSTKFQQIGVEVAWAGYPVIADPHLCLFTGTIAAFIPDDDSYLIDGVAINGVSGGPVFVSIPNNPPELIGSVSAYISNRQRGDALPGLLRAQDVTPFHETIRTMKSLDEARAKREDEQQQEREKDAAAAASDDHPEKTDVQPPIYAVNQ